MIVFHGTQAGAIDGIRRCGLAAQGSIARIGPWVTTDGNRAAWYALRACCVDLCQRGVPDRLDLAAEAIVLEIDVAPARPTVDPAADGDFVIRGGRLRGPATIHAFDPRNYLTSEEQVRRYAGAAQYARTLELLRPWMRT